MADAKSLPTREELEKLFIYDEVTGELWWKVKHKLRRVDVPAGGICVNGYKRVKFGGRSYKIHRLVWVMHYGSDVPQGMSIDHLNRNKIDNRIVNLRLADNYIQNQNRVVSNSPMRCVFKDCHRPKYWRILMRRNWKHVKFPRFLCLGKALQARNAFERAEGIRDLSFITRNA